MERAVKSSMLGVEDVVDFAMENVDYLHTMLGEMPVFVDKIEKERAFLEDVRIWVANELDIPYDVASEAIDDDSISIIMADRYEPF